MASFVADRRYLSTKRTRPVAIDLRGAGTNWGASTTFTLSGVSGCAVSGSPIVNSTTWVRLEVTTGTGVGTLTITDGGTGGTGATATIPVKPLHSARRWFAGLCPR